MTVAPADLPFGNCAFGGHGMATFTVTINGDSGPGSLRQAIADADLDPDADTIVFDATTLMGQTITLTSGELLISSALAIAGDIDGNGTPDITVSGNHASRVFAISASGDATLNGLVIRDGNAGLGGGIFNNAGTVTLSNVTLSGNTASFGGGIENSMSLLELLHFLEARLSLKLNYIHLPWRQSDQKFFVADNSKAQRLIHWVPKTTREQGLETVINWEKEATNL